MNTSWQRLSKDYAEFAINALRLLVAARRQTGMKTSAALEIDAATLGITARRARRIFERDRDPIVGFDECAKIVGGVVQCRRDIADWMRNRADEMDYETDALELSQKQLTLWGGEEWGNTNGAASAQKLAA